MPKTKTEYLEELSTIENLTNYTEEQKQTRILTVIAEVLLDILETD